MGRIVQTFLKEWWASLLSWPAYLPDILPIKHVWNVFDQQLVRCGPLAINFVSHINCMERDFPGIYSGPFLFNVITLKGSDCSTWRFYIISKSHCERFISPRIPFMHIRRLRHIQEQFWIYGKIINVPVAVYTMFHICQASRDGSFFIAIFIVTCWCCD